ncbi:MAG: hypothetical protein HUK08_00260 [Bacteroidaceae bacterium]|nr:hypothetical protein [Bacteroidaceae bacterium]
MIIKAKHNNNTLRMVVASQGYFFDEEIKPDDVNRLLHELEQAKRKICAFRDTHDCKPFHQSLIQSL